MYTCFDNLDSFLQIELQSLTHSPNKSVLLISRKRTSLYSAASSNQKPTLPFAVAVMLVLITLWKALYQ